MIEIQNAQGPCPTSEVNAAGETREQERRRQEAFDRWLAEQSITVSRHFAMADYGSMRRPLSW